VKICISNIAWRIEEEAAVADLMAALGVRGVEVAPPKLGPDPAAWTPAVVSAYREFWSRRGVSIVAMQALLFGRPDLVLFGNDAQRAALLDHLEHVFRLGGGLGAGPMVFGSPKNRLAGDLSADQARAVAVRFFRAAGDLAARHGTCLCIEPNPPEYGCDFVTTAREARALVREVASPGFGLHIDAAALHMAGEGPDVLRECGPDIRHFHASEPMLAQVKSRGAVDHAAFARTLRELRYPHWVSIEMRPHADDVDHLPLAQESLEFVTEVYGA
jgi:sugar phosphate isomerase/epimerase